MHVPQNARSSFISAGILIATCTAIAAATSLTGTRTQHPEAGASSHSIHITHMLSLEGANTAIAAAMEKAKSLNAGGAIAVVDQGGHLIAFQRIDDTFVAGAEVSIGKAATAATFKKPTKAFEDSIKDGRNALLGVHQMTPLQGGVPIMHDGFVVGAIGVSGAHSQAEDELIAMAGAAAIASQSSN